MRHYDADDLPDRDPTAPQEPPPPLSPEEFVRLLTEMRHAVRSIEDAHKLAMAQLQFAQSVVKQLNRRLEMTDR